MTRATGNADPLLEGIRDLCVRYGKFKLVSGKSSDVFLDIKSFAITPIGSYLMAERLIWMLERGGFPNAVGAIPTGGYPIVSALSALMGRRYYRVAQMGFPWPPHYSIFYLRDVRNYGESEWGDQADPDIETKPITEGYKISRGDEIVLVDDVFTTGQTVARYIQIMQGLGAIVTKVYAVVDRGEHEGHIPGYPEIPMEAMYHIDTVLNPPYDPTEMEVVP